MHVTVTSICISQEPGNKNGFAIKVALVIRTCGLHGVTVVIYREQESSDESDIMPRHGGGSVGVDNFTTFRGDQGVVNDYDRTATEGGQFGVGGYA